MILVFLITTVISNAVLANQPSHNTNEKQTKIECILIDHIYYEFFQGVGESYYEALMAAIDSCIKIKGPESVKSCKKKAVHDEAVRCYNLYYNF